MPNYIAIVHKDPDSSFGVSFPDFPGCITAGDTLDEAFRLAHEVLPFHIRGMAEDGDLIPEPSELESIMKNPDFSDGTPMLVHVPELPGKSVRLNITMDERLLKRVDDFAKRHGRTRSAFLAEAAQVVMKQGGAY